MKFGIVDITIRSGSSKSNCSNNIGAPGAISSRDLLRIQQLALTGELRYNSMKLSLCIFSLLAIFCVSGFAAVSIYAVPLKDISGKDTTLGGYKGKVLLIVNVASKCGYTPQYAGLEALFRNTKTRDF